MAIEIRRKNFTAVGSEELKKRSRLTQDKSLRNEINDELNSRFAEESGVKHGRYYSNSRSKALKKKKAMGHMGDCKHCRAGTPHSEHKM